MSKLNKRIIRKNLSRDEAMKVFEALVAKEANQDLSKRSAIYDAVVPQIVKDYGLTNAMQVPRISRIIVSCGPSSNAKPEVLFGHLRAITGQLPVITKARVSNYRYKVRKGMEVGVKVSLTGANMLNFLYQLKYALLNIREFEAISEKSINQTKNGCQLNIGLDHIGCFQALPYMGAGVKMGCTITIIARGGSKHIDDKRIFATLLYYHGIPMSEIIEGSNT